MSKWHSTIPPLPGDFCNLTSRLQTFETEMLAEEENFAALARINCELEDGTPGGGAVLQQAGNGGAVDQGGQAGRSKRPD